MKLLVIMLLMILLFLVLRSSTKFKFSLIKYNEDDHVTVNISTFYNMLIYTQKIPFINLVGKHKGPTVHNKSLINIDEINAVINNYKITYFKYQSITNYIIRKLMINSIVCHTEIGTGDAAQTAIMAGLIWSIKSSVFPIITKHYELSDLSIDVVPNYDSRVFKTSTDCIFSIRLGHIMIIRAKILLIQIKDGVKYEWSSDRVFNEDYNGKH